MSESKENGIGVIYCDDSIQMEQYPELKPEEKERNESFWLDMEREFFGEKNFDNSTENLRMAV